MAAETKQNEGRSEGTVQSMTQKAKDAANTAAEKAKGVAANISNTADKGVATAGSGISHAGEQMREHGPQEGMLGKANSAIASTMEQTGRYLEEQGLSGMGEDLTNVIRRYPVASMLVGVGLGFLLARLTTSTTRSDY
jgi:hypothetical protein